MDTSIEPALLVHRLDGSIKNSNNKKVVSTYPSQIVIHRLTSTPTVHYLPP